MTAWTNYLQYISFQMKHHLQFRAWIFKSMASIYLSLRISYLLGREVLLWGHARAGGRGHRGTATAPFEQRSHSLQPPHLGKELRFSRIWNCEIFWRNPARCVQRYRWRRGQIPEQITEQTGYDLLYRSCRSLIPSPAFAPPATSRVTLNHFPAFLLPPSVAFPFAPSRSLSLSLSLSATPSPPFLPFQRPHLSFLLLTEHSPLGCPML